jgi:Tol biopolymer transport system component/imidazolonepropionase-like amidohydrolase
MNSSRFLFCTLLLSPLLVFAQGKKNPKKAPAKKKDPWTVDQAHGPEGKVQFETSQGTWMSVDVSPDGKTIVFDLLGDLYLLPMSGGKAKPLTRGRSYDFQPRWSPNGKEILFSSDRGGTDNIWIVSADGKSLRALTQEKDKVTNSGDWSADGQYVLVRKRLTDGSSIGTVELWLVDKDGGSGVQVTKKSQFGDANGPVFGPNGRFIYFSGRKGRFQYNRNVNDGFWKLQRLDMRSGETRTLSRSAGGSAKPRISPDGKSIALIRRIRSKSCLFLHDLRRGEERLVTEDLDPDMQEAFAWTGAYPGYDWSSSNEIVISAGGKIWRVNVSTGTKAEIPFQVKVERQFGKPLRFKQAIDSPRVPIRVMRWMQQSPDKSTLYFGALGQLYVQGSAAKEPRRLTQSTHLEYAPSLSADGQWLVYVGWTDRSGGHIYKCRRNGKDVTQLTTDPGNYFRPSFSHDGKSIVFIRGSNIFHRTATLTGEDWLELSLMPVKGGQVTKVKTIPRISSPRFSPDNQRIYYVENDKDKYSQLVSVNLGGEDLRRHLKMKFLGELMLSPDARYVAYQKRYQVFVNSIPPVSHQIVEDGGQLPHFQLSKIGGDWPNWTNNNTVTYSLGNQFFSQDLKTALQKSRAKQHKIGVEKDWLLKPQSRTVAMTHERHRPKGLLALVHGRLITMNGDEIIENGTIIVQNNRILQIGSSKDVKVPANAYTFDISGRTVIPGYVDVHAHMHWGFRDVFPEQDHSYFANLAYGVTTIHDPSAFSQTVFGQAERVATGKTIGPRVYSTGTILYGADSMWTAKLNKPQDAIDHIKRLKAYGAISVKSYMQPRREQRQWLLAAARKEKVMVFPEGGGNFEMNLNMILDGHSGIEHTLPIAPLYKDVVQLLAQTKVGITPTMLVSYGGISGERWFYKHFDVWKNQKLLRFTPQDWLDQRSRRRESSPEGDYHHKRIAVALKAIVEAGGRIQLGSHGQLQGLGAHWELWAIGQGGMKAHDVLRCGTQFSAEYIGMDHEIGSLKKGMLADFQILAKNPLPNKIENTDSLVYVVSNGRVFNASSMDQIWPQKKKCPRFYWQK